jgi:hypothetical protein
MRLTPGLVLWVLVVLLTTQLTRLVAPGRGPYLWTLLLSVAGLIGGELIAGAGHLASPEVGVLHPLADACLIAALQLVGAVVARPRREPS